MARSLTIAAAGNVDGQIHVRYGKVTRQFNSLAEVRDWTRGVLASDDGGDDILLALLLAKGFASGNIASVIGKTVTFDPALAANIVRVT
jgi:hypothetical protein